MIRAIKRIYESDLGCSLQYKLTETGAFVEGKGDVRVFGISIEKFAEDDYLPFGEAATYNDISVNEAFVSDLYNKVIACKVTPLHLFDVVSDALDYRFALQ